MQISRFIEQGILVSPELISLNQEELEKAIDFYQTKPLVFDMNLYQAAQSGSEIIEIKWLEYDKNKVLNEKKGTPLDASKGAKIPFLGLFGGADPGIPPEQVQQLDQNFDTTGVTHDIRIYDGAPHSFFDRRFADYQKDCDDAWMRMLDFIKQQTK